MHHAHAAQPRLVRVADELAQGLARLVHAQAVQVELALDAPVARAQAAGLTNVSLLAADDGLGKGTSKYGIDLSK